MGLAQCGGLMGKFQKMQPPSPKKLLLIHSFFLLLLLCPAAPQLLLFLLIGAEEFAKVKKTQNVSLQIIVH